MLHVHRQSHGRLGWLALPAWMLLVICPLLVGGCASGGPTGGPARRSGDEAALRQIRVLIYNDKAPTTVAVAGSFRIVDAAGRALADTPSPMQITIAPQGDGLALNGRSMPTGCRIVPRTDGSLQIGSHPYHGSLTMLNRGGQLWLINNLDIEQYLPGVLTGELFPKFHIEAFKAQAVAARTYALYQKFVNPHADYDVSNTTASMVYVGAGSDKAVQAVRDTHGRVLTWGSASGERIFCAYFSSTCGGVTSNVSNLLGAQVIPPLAGGVHCGGCAHATYYTWPAVRMSRQDLTQKLRSKYPQAFSGMGPIARIDATESTPEGRAVWLVVSDDRGEQVRMRASQFRLAVGPGLMRSTWCRIDRSGESFVFSNGRGFGHGVGMCQWGADGLARAGWNWKQILLHYYPKSHITRAY
mgnify:CR=1 FL=1